MRNLGSDAQFVPKFLRCRIRFGIRVVSEFFALIDSGKEFLGRRPDMTFGDFAENFLFKYAQKKAKIHQKRQFAVERGVFSIKCVEYVEFVRWCRTNYRKWAFPHIYVRSGYIDGYAVRGCTRSCRNASISSRRSFCTLF